MFIRTNTKIGKGAVSVSYAAVEKIHKDLNISNPKFLCVGLGETSQLSIRHLHQKGYPNLKITNRTNKKASEFASELGYSSVDFSSFKEELKKVDVAIFSTSSKNPLLSKNEVEKIMSERDNELLMIDLSVPRNIPDSCNNCLLYTSPSPRDNSGSRMPSSA